MNLLLLTPEDAVGDGSYRITGPRNAHLQNVLHSSVGDEIEIGLLNGPRGVGRVIRQADDESIVTVEHIRDAPDMPLTIDVICAIPRPKILRKVLYVAAMMGIRSLQLVRTNRTEKSYLLSPLLEPGNYRPYLLDGLSQGKQTRLPVVKVHPLFRPFAEDDLPLLPGFSESPRIVADLGPYGNIESVLSASPMSQIFLAVGPEGGWVDFERDMLIGHGFRQFSLGRSILRVEFAFAAALSQIELVCTSRNRL
jgi:RsmE family RNA methyltransferase